MKIGRWLIALALIGGAGYFAKPYYDDWSLENDLRVFAEAEANGLQTLIDEIDRQVKQGVESIQSLQKELERTGNSSKGPLELFEAAQGTNAIDASEFLDQVGYPIFHFQSVDENENAYAVNRFVKPDKTDLDFSTAKWRVLHPSFDDTGLLNRKSEEVMFYEDEDSIRWIYQTAQLDLLRSKLLKSRQELYLAHKKFKLSPGNDSEYAERARVAEEATNASRKLFGEIQAAIESNDEVELTIESLEAKGEEQSSSSE